MRICYVADAASVHTQKWAAHFAREHDVHVLSFRDSPIPGARVYHLGSLGALGKARYPLQVPRLRRLLHRIDPDVVHALSLTSYGFVAALAGRHPLVTSVWGYDILQTPQRSPLHLWVTRYALRHADIVTATGEGLAAATRPYMPPGRPVHVVPYGIDLDKFSRAGEPDSPPGLIVPPPASGTAGPVIASVKSLVPVRGFQFLVGAMPAVLEHHPGARLILAGDGPERGQLQQQVEALGLSAQVLFLGEVPNARVPELLRQVDVYVQPSLLESFGVSALEASAMAIPVVATAVEGGRDVVRDGETGLLVPPADSAALAAAILRLLDDRALGRSMGEAGRRFVAERYQWRDNAALMAAVYAQAIEGHRAGRTGNP